VRRNKMPLISFIGGAWHGEAREYFGVPPATQEIGGPPTFLGDSWYGSSIAHHSYFRRKIGDRYYLVAEELMKENLSDEELLNLKIETPNMRRMREEQERKTRSSLAAKEKYFKEQLLSTCIAKHEALDGLGLKNPTIDTLIDLENTIWGYLKDAQKRAQEYKGEEPKFKEVHKVR
jgi:hypothetical protein